MSETNNANGDMQLLTERTEKLIGALTNALLATAETAAERIELAAKVCQMQQRAAAFAAVLESTEAARQALTARMATATGPIRAMLAQQASALAATEVEILSKAGVPAPAAQAALALVDAGPAGDSGRSGEGSHKRDGRRFVRVGAGSNGNGHGSNGH